MANISIHGFSRGFRRGGLTTSMAPRMPVITEDVVQANRGRKCDSTANGMNISYIKNKSCSEEEEENTGIRFNEPATFFSIPHKMTNSSSSKQQQQQQQQQQQATPVYPYIASAEAAVLCIHIIHTR